ncbi:MAG: preprotein translocase subunit SecA, partial [Flavobacteriaceae bacterium]
MSIINSILKTFVGDKTKKDLSQITPLVAEIKSHQKNLETLSHDELRQKTIAFKELISEERKSFDLAIETFKENVQKTSDIDEKESLYQQIDTQDEEAQKAVEALLNKILPEAFAVVKETARRFVENTSIEVTASAYDRELSQQKEYIQLKRD